MPTTLPTYNLADIMRQAHRTAKAIMAGKYGPAPSSYKAAFADALTDAWQLEHMRVDYARDLIEAGISASLIASCASDRHVRVNA